LGTHLFPSEEHWIQLLMHTITTKPAVSAGGKG
jgi:hypothetical protein